MKSIIHINNHNIKFNRKNPKNKKPVISVKNYKSNRYGFQANILDQEGGIVARIIYSPDKPLNCGAVCWVETYNKIIIEKN